MLHRPHPRVLHCLLLHRYRRRAQRERCCLSRRRRHLLVSIGLLGRLGAGGEVVLLLCWQALRWRGLGGERRRLPLRPRLPHEACCRFLVKGQAGRVSGLDSSAECAVTTLQKAWRGTSPAWTATVASTLARSSTMGGRVSRRVGSGGGVGHQLASEKHLRRFALHMLCLGWVAWRFDVAPPSNQKRTRLGGTAPQPDARHIVQLLGAYNLAR